jgi:(E)-benzylidenesuccinyl-CoA hydratase
MASEPLASESRPAVLYDLEGHIATITYNRPEAMNAVNRDMRRGLNDAFGRFRDEDDAWVAIVTGAGKAFCAGADLRDPAGAVGDFPGSFWERPTLNSFESGWEIYKPVIAAVNGHCIGYGLTLVTWCDFVLASDRATFAYPEAALGIPAIVGAIRLPLRISWSDAMELLMTGERIDAATAAQIGLVWRVLPHDSLLDAARELAERLTKGAPLAQRAMKEMAMRAPHLSSPEAVRLGEAMRIVASGSADAREGMAAAAEKRTARWTGR